MGVIYKKIIGSVGNWKRQTYDECSVSNARDYFIDWKSGGRQWEVKYKGKLYLA